MEENLVLQTKRMDLEYENYMEVEMREHFLFEEKIRLFRLKQERDKQELVQLEEDVKRRAKEKEEQVKREKE